MKTKFLLFAFAFLFIIKSASAQVSVNGDVVNNNGSTASFRLEFQNEVPTEHVIAAWIDWGNSSPVYYNGSIVSVGDSGLTSMHGMGDSYLDGTVTFGGTGWGLVSFPLLVGLYDSTTDILRYVTMWSAVTTQ